MARVRDGKRGRRRHAPVRPCYLARWKRAGRLAETGGRTRRGVVHCAKVTEQRDWSSECKASISTNTKFPVHCCNGRGAGPPKKMATPTTECEVKLLEGREIITDELETK